MKRKVVNVMLAAMLIGSMGLMTACGSSNDTVTSSVSSAETEATDGSGSGLSDMAAAMETETVTASAEANPEAAITLDGIAMGQLRTLVTTASIAYDGGELDETHSTNAGVTEADGATNIEITEENANGIVIRNTGSFVLGGESDAATVAQQINFSFITGEYSDDWDAFCEAMGYDASKSIEDIAQELIDQGLTDSYTNLGLSAPETVSLSDYTMDVSNAGTNDMGGFGAALYVSDNAVAEFNNFKVITRGAARGALFTRFGAEATVNDSTFYAVSDPTDESSMGCPPGLFIEGKVRATNAVGSSEVTYNNSIVISQGWGALSTDSDDLYTDTTNPTTLNINDSYIAVLTSGYGAYSDGAARDTFVDSYIDVPDYGAVETGTGLVSFQNCVLNVGMYGVMTHSGNSVGDIEFIDSELHVGESAVMLRDTANKVLFDNTTIDYDGTSTINAEAAASFGVDLADVDANFGTTDGVDTAYPHTEFRSPDSHCIVKLLHNSDSGSGTESTGAAPEVTIKNSKMSGDILNTAAMEGDENTATSGPAGEGVRTARSLDVTLDASEIEGAISLGQDTWEITHFASGSNESLAIGYAASTELGMFADEGFGLSLTLANGAVWAVTADSYLTELTIDDSSSIKAADGEVSMTVDGAETEIAAGTYTGEIVISVK